MRQSRSDIADLVTVHDNFVSKAKLIQPGHASAKRLELRCSFGHLKLTALNEGSVVADEVWEAFPKMERCS